MASPRGTVKPLHRYIGFATRRFNDFDNLRAVGPKEHESEFDVLNSTAVRL
jgi:hypothetical protein